MWPFKSTQNHCDALISKMDEIYSLLNVATPEQQVVVEFNDPKESNKMVVCLNGFFWEKTYNPMSELREFNRILALNIANGREISIRIQ